MKEMLHLFVDSTEKSNTSYRNKIKNLKLTDTLRNEGMRHYCCCSDKYDFLFEIYKIQIRAARSQNIVTNTSKNNYYSSNFLFVF